MRSRIGWCCSTKRSGRAAAVRILGPRFRGVSGARPQLRRARGVQERRVRAVGCRSTRADRRGEDFGVADGRAGHPAGPRPDVHRRGGHRPAAGRDPHATACGAASSAPTRTSSASRCTLDRRAYTVVGVMGAGFTFPNRGPHLNNLPADVYVPISFTDVELRRVRHDVQQHGRRPAESRVSPVSRRAPKRRRS